MSLKESAYATENEQAKFAILFSDIALVLLFCILDVIEELVGANLYTNIMRHLNQLIVFALVALQADFIQKKHQLVPR